MIVITLLFIYIDYVGDLVCGNKIFDKIARVTLVIITTNNKNFNYITFILNILHL